MADIKYAGLNTLAAFKDQADATYSLAGHTHKYAGSSSVGGAATSANKVNTNLVVKLNGGTTEGTNLFTFNGSAAKTVNITPAGIGAAATGSDAQFNSLTINNGKTYIYSDGNAHFNQVYVNGGSFIYSDGNAWFPSGVNIGYNGEYMYHNNNGNIYFRYANGAGAAFQYTSLIDMLNSINSKLPLTGGTISGDLKVTGNAFLDQVSTGEAGTTYHSIFFGQIGRDKVEIYEWGGEFNLWQSNASGNTLIMGVSPSAFTYKGNSVITSTGGTLIGNVGVQNDSPFLFVQNNVGWKTGGIHATADNYLGLYDSSIGKMIVHSDVYGNVYVDGNRAHHWVSFSKDTYTTLPGNSGNGTTYLIMTAHNSHDSANGLWIYRPANSTLWPIRQASAVTFALDGWNIIIGCNGMEPTCHYLQIY